MSKRRIIPMVVLVLAAAGVAGWLLLRPSGGAAGSIEASGTVEATEADLGFQAGGRVDSIAYHEGDAVPAGAVVATLDAAELRARLGQAQAAALAAHALLEQLERGARPEELEQARAAADAARARLEDAKRTLERTRTLYQGGAASREQFDQASTLVDVATSQNQQASEGLRLVKAGPRQEQIQAQRAVVRQSEAAVAQARAALDNASIKAPFAGVVTVRHREPGEAVSPGLPVLTLLDPNDRWVRIYVRENQVGRVSIGQKAVIRSDSDPDKRYEGRVRFIASQAEFTPRNVQTAEERVKLVYAVKVAITGDAARELKPGVPADVTLEPAGSAR
ncbi:MAG TPA: HlyD family efflux transporter periplasmic adaptor subunit [Longimicrobiales bacterium]